MSLSVMADDLIPSIVFKALREITASDSLHIIVYIWHDCIIVVTVACIHIQKKLRPGHYSLERLYTHTYCSTQRPLDSVAGDAGHGFDLQEKELSLR